MLPMSIVKSYSKYVPSSMYFCICFGSKLLYEMYKSDEQEAEEVVAKDGLPRVDCFKDSNRKSIPEMQRS